MRKVLCLLLVLLTCTALASPAFAAEGTFVPSISYKDGPDLDKAELDGQAVDGCIVVTSIPEAKDKSTDIYQEDRDLLLEVYGDLTDGTMKLPLEDNYVIRDLVDVSFRKSQCVEPGHSHKEDLAKEGTTITLTFDLGIKKGVEVAVLAYIDGEWVEARSVVNNGNGTVTCVLEDICPVAFCLEEDYNYKPPKTGDEIGRQLPLWIALMAGSLAAIVVLVILYNKKNTKGHKHHRHHKH